MQILIKNGTVVTALDEYKTDLLIENEKIVCPWQLDRKAGQ